MADTYYWVDHRSVASELWASESPERVLETPLFLGLSSGDIPAEEFRKFVSHDVQFTALYVKCLQDILPSLDDDTKVFVEFLIADITVNRNFLQDSGFSCSLQFEELHEMSMFRNFVVETVSMGLVPNAVAALAVHARLHTFIGEHIRRMNDLSTHPYKVWVEYCLNHVSRVARLNDCLLDQVCRDITEEDLEIARWFYHQAVELECDFFTSFCNGGIAFGFWDCVRPEAARVLETPILVGLSSRDLPLQLFRNFVSNDLFFTNAYIKCLQDILKVVNDKDIKMLLEFLIADLSVNKSFLQDSGYGCTLQFKELNEMTVYRNFVLETVLVGFVPNLVAALAVHARLYTFIGEHIRSLDDLSTHPYRVWVNFLLNHVSRVASLHDCLLDQVCRDLTEEDREIARGFYNKALKLEREVFTSLHLQNN